MRLPPCLHGNINKEVNRIYDSISGLWMRYHLIIQMSEMVETIKNTIFRFFLVLVT